MTASETVGFKPEFCKCISIMYLNIQVVVQVKGKRSKALGIKSSVQQCCLLSPFLYALVLEPLLCKFRDENVSPALDVIPFAGPLSAKLSAYADDITVFVSSCQDIKTMK